MCFAGAIGCLILFITGQTGTLPLLSLIAVQIITSTIILKVGESKQAHKENRRAILKNNPSFVWRILGLAFVLPLLVGGLSFYLFGVGFESALIIFLGSSYLCQIVINLMLMPHMHEFQAATFD